MAQNGIKTWTTKKGEEIPIRQMETSHLKNTVAMLERKAHSSYSVAGISDPEDAIADELEFHEHPKLRDLRKELRRRKAA